MAYPINPNNDNIDNLSPDFRDFVLGRNLQNINPELEQSGFSFFGLGDQYDENLSNDYVPDAPSITDVSGQYRDYNLGRNLPLRNPDFDDLENTDNQFYARLDNYLRSRGQQYRSGDLTEQIEDAGNVESNVHVYRDIVNLTENTYGPAEINYYNCPDKPVEITGFEQYSTQVGGDFRSSIVGTQLGFSSVSGIDFESELADIGQERRTFEIAERIKLNFISDTVGAVNLDPFNLLTGQDLIEPNYRITAPGTFLGRAAEFTASLAGFNVPTSIIPGSREFSKIGSDQFQQDLLDFTGKGQRTTIFDNIFINKYTPSQIVPDNTEDRSKLANAISRATVGPNPPEPATYLSTPEEFSEAQISREEREKSIGEKINEAIGSFIDGLVNRTGVGETTSLQPNPESLTLPLDPNSAMGADGSSPGLEDLGFDSTLESEIISSLSDAFNDFGDLTNPTIGRKTKELYYEYDSGGYSLPGLPLLDWRERPSGSGTDTLVKSNPFKRGLLKYTQDLINNARKNPIGEKSAARYIGIFDSDRNVGDFTKSGVDIKAHTKFSKGNLVKNADDSYYCRSWSTRNPYHKFVNLIRDDKLYRNEKIDGFSVLEENGIVKIGPYKGDYSDPNVSQEQLTKYMFSIENLAWKDSPELLSLANCEKGPFGGRIMWFPPYNLDFTDNTNVSWETHNFVGRPEPIYTYNHTERKGTLSFTIIMDHPSIINDRKQFNEDDVLWKFFAGCADIDLSVFDNILPTNDRDVLETATVLNSQKIDPKPLVEPETIKPPIDKLVGYFENAKTDVIGPDGNRAGVGRDIAEDLSNGYETGPGGLNENFESQARELAKFLVTEEGHKYSVIIKGFTSGSAPSKYNKILSIDRTKGVYKYLQSLIAEEFGGVIPSRDRFTSFVRYGYTCSPGDLCLKAVSGNRTTRQGTPGYDDLEIKFKEINTDSRGAFQLIALGEEYANSPNDENNIVGDNDPNSLSAKKDRRVEITLKLNERGVAEELDEEKDLSFTIEFEEELEALRVTLPEELNERLSNLYDECRYFERIKKDDPFIYDQITEKIKYFHPSFHSMTPEGFNSRLTFLQQCTRPGSSTILNEGNIQEVSIRNLAFGRPPVCVLRIGDFYHTKIIIDSVNMSFDPLQWDLNPEGIGVQPMLAKIDLNFSFVGGSSIKGPIKQLQNALSFNFFANTSVYNERRTETKRAPKDGSQDNTGQVGDDVYTYNYGSFKGPGEYDEENKRIIDNNTNNNNTGAESQRNDGTLGDNNITDTPNTDNIPIEKNAEQSEDLKNQISETPPGTQNELIPKPQTGCGAGKSVDFGLNRSGNLQGAKNVIVGSSSVGVLDAISSQTGKYGGFTSNGIYVYYNCGGKTLQWLYDQMVEDENIYESVEQFFQVGIGTNDGFKLSRGIIREYTNLVKSWFPNATLNVITGTYGWGGVANTKAYEVEQYYQQYIDEGWRYIKPTDDSGNFVSSFLPVGNHDPNNPWFQAQMKALRDFGV